ncbi:AAA family ATPase [Shouchella lehensis]|uniref:Shikimate kinase n=1 Tax=Shouchella lehensis TaxID=300825 RepID=A0A4Y7WL40_9BACI|nr:AAA family ATPase [Shouchella lehensis]MBG9783306.1 shikimate kinase [Shouchella lehensis]TES49315.1 shikimate kinase [Shouchella lehensis]
MADLIILFGPQAVGKMTVGEALAEKTGMKLFHNHMTIDAVAPVLGFTDETWRLVNQFRREIFQAAAKSDLKGVIFTYVWAFDLQKDWDYVADISAIFEEQGGRVYFVELEASLEERLVRNKSEHRLEKKPTKRDIVFSENELKETAESHRLNSKEGELNKKQYVRINNTSLYPNEVAQHIQDVFHFH